MIPRYESPKIAAIWSDENKVRRWQETEQAVLQARANLLQICQSVPAAIAEKLQKPVDLDWWRAREEVTHHDLNAFLDERLRFLPPELQCDLHHGMTSYDAEEPPFALALSDSLKVLSEAYLLVEQALVKLAERHRYTIMNARTHGQEAELQSFGKRCLCWLKDLRISFANLKKTWQNLVYSKLSGAIGNYRGLDPDVESEALRLLGLRPYLGVTQIMPRALYAPVASAVCQMVLVLHKVALDIRLAARSGRPILQEPFGRKQKGSSAMPHKKNTISCEQVEGMARMAQGYCQMIRANIVTWEERAIEQSSVERVAWPDLFHIACHSANTMARVLGGLNVYPDNMLLEIVDSCGCYASSEAKEWLRAEGAKHGLSTEDAYRIVQLAAFNAFEPSQWQENLRQIPCPSLDAADTLLSNAAFEQRNRPASIQKTISSGQLRVSPQLDTPESTVRLWNDILQAIFVQPGVMEEWNQLFKPSHLLRNEHFLYEEILGK